MQCLWRRDLSTACRLKESTADCTTLLVYLSLHCLSFKESTADCTTLTNNINIPTLSIARQASAQIMSYFKCISGRLALLCYKEAVIVVSASVFYNTRSKFHSTATKLNAAQSNHFSFLLPVFTNRIICKKPRSNANDLLVLSVKPTSCKNCPFYFQGLFQILQIPDQPKEGPTFQSQSDIHYLLPSICCNPK